MVNSKESIWKKINVGEENECWEWGGYLVTGGYGRMMINYKSYLVHRLVYEETYGPIRDDLCVLHSCDNPKCCNPKHLWPGTHRDNMNDKIKKGRSNHSVGEKNGGAKLNEEDVLEIRSLYSTGKYLQKDLCKLFNISRSNIWFIISNKTWRHV